MYQNYLILMVNHWNLLMVILVVFFLLYFLIQHFYLGTKFYCTINDILTSDGEFWVERVYSPENERKFRQFIHILSLYATSYESLKEVYIGQLVALHYESSWHRALVVSKSNEINVIKPASARVRLVDYGSSLYVNVCQLKWLPEQFYLFPFKVNENKILLKYYLIVNV